MFSRSLQFPTVRVDPVDEPVKVFTMGKPDEILRENYNRITFSQFDEIFTEELEAHGIDFEKFSDFHMFGGIEELKRNIENSDDLALVQAILPQFLIKFGIICLDLLG